MHWARVWKQAAKNHRNRSFLLGLGLGTANRRCRASAEQLLRAQAQMQEQAETIKRLELALITAEALIPGPVPDLMDLYRMLRRMHERGHLE